jgi:hypothetical protein
MVLHNSRQQSEDCIDQLDNRSIQFFILSCVAEFEEVLHHKDGLT